MSPEERDEERLQEYLEGDSRLSRLYRREADEQPGARLDARILAEARRAVSHGSRVVRSPFSRHWLVPTSLAAVLVLSVSMVLLMPDPALEPGLEHDRAVQPEPPVPAAAGTPAPADSVRLPTQTRQAIEAEEDAVGERAGSASPRESAVTDQDANQAVGKAVGQAVDKASEKRKLEQKSTAESATQSIPAAPAAGRIAGEAASAAPPARAREPVPPPKPTPTDVVRSDPEAWLRFIERLLNAHDRGGARSNLRAFLARYPDFPLPSTLTSLAESLDAERP